LPAWLKLGGEIRGRLEDPTGIGYVPDTQDVYYLHRVRLNIGLKLSPHLRTVIQFQDSHAPGHRCKPALPSVANTLDLRMGYLEVGHEEGVPWLLRVGRQPLVFGDMRLVSTSNWGNVGPAFDGARFSYQTNGFKLDWFATTVVTAVTDHFDQPRSDRMFHGFYSTINRGLHGKTLEAYVLWKDNLVGSIPRGPSGHHSVYTIGSHSFGKLRMGFDYNVEMAMQTGHIGGSGIQAWAGHWEASHATGSSPWRPRVIAEYNYATGDHDPRDGTVGTFDHLYTTSKFGSADNIGWRNIHEAIAGAEWKPGRKWRAKLCYHDFWLASRTDALYSFGTAVLAHNPLASSAKVGRELDLRIIYQHNNHLQLWGGYGYFFAGPYIKQSTPGAGVHSPYMMWTYTF